MSTPSQLTGRTKAAAGGQSSSGIDNRSESAVRIHTDDQLLDFLDEIVAGSTRGDRTRAEAAEFWAELLTREGHPLATCMPDENLVDWHTRDLFGDLGGARILDIGCGNGRNGRWFGERHASVEGIDISAPLLDLARRSTSFAARYLPGSSTSSTTPAASTTSPRTVGPPTSTGCCHSSRQAVCWASSPSLRRPLL